MQDENVTPDVSEQMTEAAEAHQDTAQEQGSEAWGGEGNQPAGTGYAAPDTGQGDSAESGIPVGVDAIEPAEGAADDGGNAPLDLANLDTGDDGGDEPAGEAGAVDVSDAVDAPAAADDAAPAEAAAEPPDTAEPRPRLSRRTPPRPRPRLSRRIPPRRPPSPPATTTSRSATPTSSAAAATSGSPARHRSRRPRRPVRCPRNSARLRESRPAWTRAGPRTATSASETRPESPAPACACERAGGHRVASCA